MEKWRSGLFGSGLRFRLSHPDLVGTGMILRRRPMIGTTRPDPKILAPRGYSISSNAPAEAKRVSRLNQIDSIIKTVIIYDA